MKMRRTSSDPIVSEPTQNPEVARAISLFLDALRKDYAVDEVRLYGSRARGDFQPDSDVDLAVVLHGERGDIWKTAMAMSDITFDVLIETGISVSALPLWGDDLDHPERAPNPVLIQNIQREGLRL
jgi:predicted nucleotidyltransferase